MVGEGRFRGEGDPAATPAPRLLRPPESAGAERPALGKALRHRAFYGPLSGLRAAEKRRPPGFSPDGREPEESAFPLGTFGAGEENRTLMTSLEGWSSTIELRPHQYPGQPFSEPIRLSSRHYHIVTHNNHFHQRYANARIDH